MSFPLPSKVAREEHLPHRLVPTSVALACAFMVSSAMAQTPSATTTTESSTTAQTDGAAGNALPTVSVTARKRSEKLLEVPISIQSFSEKEIRAAGITNVTDVAAHSGFNFTSAQGSGAQGRAFGVTTFRGLQGELNFPWDNSGGVFIDGIFISGGVSSIGMTDVARVEVLKGPQNAFFGRSTFGGAVNFITKNPSSTLTGEVNTKFDQRGSSSTDFTIEGPLKEDLLTGRLSLGSSNKAATGRATDGGELGAEGSRFITGTLHLTPTSGSWLRLRGHYQRDEDSTPNSGLVPATGNTSCVGQSYSGYNRSGNAVNYTPSVPYFCGGLPSYYAGAFDANTAIPAGAVAGMVNNAVGDSFLAAAPQLDHAGMLREIKRLSVQGGVELPYDMDLAVNAGFNEAYSNSIFDLDRTKTNNFFNQQVNLTRDLTLDARLSTNQKASLRGLVGASYFHSTYQLSQIDFNAVYGVTAASFNTGNYLNLKSSVPAIYASAEYDFNPQWTLSADARYQQDKVDFTALSNVVTSNKEKSFLPRLTLRFKPEENTTTYVSAARGVQPLTVNSGYINANAAGQAYLRSLYPNLSAFTQQPQLDSVELGIKQRLNTKLQYSAALYTQKWKDRISSTSVFNPTSCGITFNTPACPFSAAGAGVSIGNDARVSGLELALDAQMTSQWSAGAYLDLKHATWTRFDAANAPLLTGTAVNFNGNELGRVPAVSGSANVTYRYGLTDGWRGYTRGDVTYIGKRWDTDFNFTKIAGYSSFDLRQGFEKDNLSLELFVTNLFDSRGYTSAARTINLGVTPLTSFTNQAMLVNVQDPRAVGVRARYTF